MNSVQSIATELTGSIKGRVEKDLQLAPLTTYRVGGRAALYVEPVDVSDLDRLAVALRGCNVPVLPLGRGSNLLFSDSGFPGVVVRLGSAFAQIEETSAGRARAGGAALLPQITNWTARRGLAGMEFAIAIPGSMGGGVRMNAGAHGGDLSQVVTGARIFRVSDGGVGDLSAVDLGFSYRRSALTDSDIVLEADLELRADDPAEVKVRVETNRRHRAETQPAAVQNAGSVFKNPPGDHSGRLVEATGLKGFAVGGASVSELHANFFIAKPGSSAQDVFDLVHAVRKRVHESCGVMLEPEIRFVGEFRDAMEQA